MYRFKNTKTKIYYMKNKSIIEAFSQSQGDDSSVGQVVKKSSFMFVWSARIVSLFMMMLVLLIGIVAFGYADNIGKVKVDHLEDTEFVLEQGGVLSVDGAKMANTLVIPSGQNIYTYISEVKKSNKPFWMVAAKLSAKLYDATSVNGKVRVSQNSEDWSDWYDLELENSVGKNEEITEVPILLGEKANYVQYSIVLSTEDVNISPEVYDVDLVLIDPDDKLAFVKKSWSSLIDKVSGGTEIDIVSRQDWGADESIMTWDDMEYAPVEQIIVHHTAGSNNSPLDPAAVVRGIYYFHAVEKDWGDIGYNYIIDQHGNIYEGRDGGWGVVAAHSSGNNYGSVGIAVIGNYSNDAPSSQSLAGLIDLVEYVGYQADLDLTGAHNFEGNNVPVVAGHRDVNPTECPGDILYSMLGDVATAAKNGESSLPAKTYEASLVSQSQDSLNLSLGETQKVILSYKNTGSAVWLRQQADVVLAPVDPYPRNSGFASASWDSDDMVGTFAQTTVAPENKATFNLDLTGIGQNGTYQEKFALVGPNGVIDGTEFVITISNSVAEDVVDNNNNNIKNENVPRENDAGDSNKEVEKPVNNQVDADLYHSSWVAQSDHLVLYPGEEATVWIDFKNTGKVPWYRDGDFPVRLGTNQPQDRNSGFADAGNSWLSANRIEMSQWGVEPGDVARFRFVVKAGNTPGIYQEYFRLVAENVTWMEDQGVYIQIEVPSPQYKAEFISQSENPIVLSEGRKARLWVELKNTGNVVWTKDGDTPVRLATDRNADRASIFYSPGYWISSNRAASMKKNAVSPGDTVRFEVVVTAPDEPGTYREYFRPVAENLIWMDDLGIYWDIEVE